MSYPFTQIKGCIAGMSTVADENMDFRFGERSDVLRAREQFMQKYGCTLPESVWMSVEHGSTVLHVTKIASRSMGGVDGVSADAFITNERSLPLCLLTADCTPLVLHDRTNNALALVHVGWKPAHLGIIASVIQEMSHLYNTAGTDCDAYIFPGIRAESYIQVNPTQRHDVAWEKHIVELEPERFSINIPSFIRAQLKASGFLDSSIHESMIDTYTDGNYFSHYRSQKTKENEGRMLTIAMLT